MKKILLIIVFAVIIKPLLPVVEYVVNYEYITKVLCENKAKPELKCNGKCHLMKELAKASEEETPISNDKKVFSHQAEVLFFSEIESFEISLAFLPFKEKTKVKYANLYAYIKSVSIFHPPTIIS